MSSSGVTSTDLVGTWRLVSHSQFQSAEGRLIYHPNGSMAVVIHGVRNSDGAPTHTIAYAGKYDVQDGYVHHRVEVAERPNRKSEPTGRYITFQGSRMILREGPELKVGFSVEWERAS